MKSAFVSQASHDLRTPLTSIKSSLDNLVRGVGGGLNERQIQVVDRARTSMQRLSALINDVLDINRIETGRTVLEKKDYSLTDSVKSIIEENRPAANQKNISIQTEGIDTPIQIHADPGKIERVINELVGNAVKYTPENGSININLRQENHHAIVSVSDTGVGMSKDDCQKIWERFYRVDEIRLAAKGSGLGLSIAKELVEMHGGKISVQSAKHEGSTFTVKLPMRDSIS